MSKGLPVLKNKASNSKMKVEVVVGEKTALMIQFNLEFPALSIASSKTHMASWKQMMGTQVPTLFY